MSIRRESCSSKRRNGAIAVETAFILPVFILLLFGSLVGGLGVFRFEQLAALSREASRYTATHGHEWAKQTGNTSPTQAEVLQNVVISRAVSMNASDLSIQIVWIDGDTGQEIDWDTSSKAPRTANSSNEPVANKVRITLTYTWMPEFFWTGPIQMTSVSEIPMSF